MGAWSHEPFGNDDSIDWAFNLERVDDLSVIEATLDYALEAGDYLEAIEASESIAAIEVLAKLLGKGTQTDAYTDKVDKWVKSVSIKPEPPLIAKAIRALELIRGENSELRKLWEESELDEWLSSLDALERALGS
jgi:uncharacterized protein (DUF2126 family)